MTEDPPGAKIKAELGELSVTVINHNGVKEAQEVFEEVWQKRLDEAVESSDALRSLARGYE